MDRFLTLALAAAAAAIATTAPLAANEIIDPARMQRAEAVANPARLDRALTGAWDVWIPGSVTYSSDGRTVYRNYQPGAAMNRLDIAADGRYRWGNASGRLEEVRPWYHQPGRRYYRLRHASGDEYEFHRSDGDQLIVLFGGVGGHAATGTRLSGGAKASSTGSAPAWAAGAGVEILWNGRWFPGRIHEAADGRYRVGYDGYGSNWDEWVDAARLRALPGTAPAPAAGQPPPVPANGSAPLDVQWQGQAASVPVPVAGGSASNPLGVQWQGAGAATQPQPTAPPPAPTAPTLPVAPVAPAAPGNPPVARPAPVPPAPVAPVAPAPSPQIAAVLVNRWRFEAIAFQDSTGSTNVDATGTLTLRADGRYEQDLYIGGILNAVRGTYAVDGQRLLTHYDWAGQPASEVMDVKLSGDGRQLTLLRHGSPMVHYTLSRID